MIRPRSLDGSPGRWSLQRFTPLVEIELRALFSEGKSLLSSLLLEPVVQVVLLAAGLQGLLANSAGFYAGHSYLEFVLPGIFGLHALRGFSRTMYRTVLDRQWGMLTIKRLSGAGGVAYTLSKVAAPALALLVQVVVVTGLAVLMGARFSLPHVVGAALISMVTVVFWAAVAIIITGFVRDYMTRDMIVTWMMLPLSLSAPVFYSLDSAPTYLQWIARFNPLAYQVQAIRDMLLDGTFHVAGLIMVALTIIISVGAVVSVSRGDALTSEGGR